MFLANGRKRIGIVWHGNHNLPNMRPLLHESERVLDFVGFENGHRGDGANLPLGVVFDALLQDPARVSIETLGDDRTSLRLC